MKTAPSGGRWFRITDRAIVLTGIGVLTALAGIYTVLGVGMPMSAFEMSAMGNAPGTMEMGDTAPAGGVLALFAMWWVMMIAMMTPSAAPTFLLFARLKGLSAPRGRALLSVGLFAFGYLAAWAVFSLGATLVHLALVRSDAFAAAAMVLTSPIAISALLIAAGLYQLTPLKRACLRQCQSPAEFLTRHRRPGPFGAAITGAHHGAYCVGCCWALMLLLFAGGVMNLWWIVGLAILVAVEKLAAGRRAVSNAVGVMLILAGAAYGAGLVPV